jgi:hypothetical protein
MDTRIHQQRIGALEIALRLPPDLDQALATLSEAENLLRYYIFAERLDGNSDASADLSRARRAGGR